jgi:ABC-2 type transport system permease protein
MSTIAIAKKDFRDGIRSRVLISLTVLFAVFIAGAAYFFTEIAPPETASNGISSETLSIVVSLAYPTYFLLPIVGTLVGYRAIVGERTSGSLKFLLGLPHSRRDVVAGKLLGRSGIITVAVLAGFAVGGIVLYALTDTFAVEVFVIYTVVTVLLGMTFVSIAIAFSSAARSSSVATTGAITLVLLFVVLWRVFLYIVQYAAQKLGLMGTSRPFPDWYIFVRDLNPTLAYENLTNALVAAIHPGTSPVYKPFYLENWFGSVVLAFWLVVPIGLAYLRFQTTDLRCSA